MSFVLLLSIFASALALSIAVAVVVKKHHILSNLAISIGLASTSAVILGDSIILHWSDLLMDWKRVVFVCETVMVTTWIVFSSSYARSENWTSFNILSKLLVVFSPLLIVFCVIFPIDDLFYSPEFEVEPVLFLGNGGYVFYLILLFYSIVAVINLESILRTSSGISRWSIKYTIFGVGGISAINIFYYSYALLYRSLDMQFVSVRAGVLLVSGLLIGYSIMKHRAMDVEVAVSRKIVFSSITLFVVGIYLLGIGVIGQGLRYLGPNVGSNITAFIGFIGAIFVLVIILSEKLRRKAIVIINKNFFRQKYDYRDQWLHFTYHVASKHNFDDLLAAIADGFMHAIRAQGASLWLRAREDETFRCVRRKYFDTGAWQPDQKLLDFLKVKKWVINSQDVNCSEIISSCAAFLKEVSIFLIVPFFYKDDLVGFIVLRDSDEDVIYNYEDYDLLKALAAQAASSIWNARLSEELTEAKEMEAIGKVSSFIVHDLKNAASMLSLTAQNARQHMDNPKFQKDAIQTIINSTDKIKRIIEKLRSIPEKAELSYSNADLGECVQSVVDEMQLNGGPSISYSVMESVPATFDVEEIKKVVINLLINAIDAINGVGEVRITTGREKNMGYIRVSDNGCGMSTEFMQKDLFKPFHTTKKSGLGVGLYQSRTIVEAHGGKMKVESREGQGSEFTIYLPL